MHICTYVHLRSSGMWASPLLFAKATRAHVYTAPRRKSCLLSSSSSCHPTNISAAEILVPLSYHIIALARPCLVLHNIPNNCHAHDKDPDSKHTLPHEGLAFYLAQGCKSYHQGQDSGKSTRDLRHLENGNGPACHSEYSWPISGSPDRPTYWSSSEQQRINIYYLW